MIKLIFSAFLLYIVYKVGSTLLAAQAAKNYLGDPTNSLLSFVPQVTQTPSVYDPYAVNGIDPYNYL